MPSRFSVLLDFAALTIPVAEEIEAAFGPGPDSLGFLDNPDDDLLPLVPAGFAAIGNQFAVSDPAHSRLVWIDKSGRIVDSLPFDQSIEDVVRVGSSQILLVRRSGDSPSPTLSIIESGLLKSTFDINGPPGADLIVGELVSNGDIAGGWFFSLDEPATYDGIYQLAQQTSNTLGLPSKTGLCDQICVDLSFEAENALRLQVDGREFLIEFLVAHDATLLPFVSLNSTQVDRKNVVLLIRAAARCDRCEAYFLLTIHDEVVHVGRVEASASALWDPMIRSRLRLDEFGAIWIMELDEQKLTLKRVCPENSDDAVCSD